MNAATPPAIKGKINEVAGRKLTSSRLASLTLLKRKRKRQRQPRKRQTRRTLYNVLAGKTHVSERRHRKEVKA